MSNLVNDILELKQALLDMQEYFPSNTATIRSLKLKLGEMLIALSEAGWEELKAYHKK